MATGTWTRRLTRSTSGVRREEDAEDDCTGGADDEADPDDVDGDVDGGVAVVVTFVAGVAFCWRRWDERDLLDDRLKNFIVGVGGGGWCCHKVDVVIGSSGCGQ